MEYVILAVFPVGEILLVARLPYDWFPLVVSTLDQSLLRFHLEVLVCIVAGRPQVHFVRIDDLRFFLQIECFSIFENNCVS